MTLIRANYKLDGETISKDFVGELAETNFYSWLAETAMERDTFQYLGRERIVNPICWKYNEHGHIEIWKGLLPIGESELYIDGWNEMDAFFKDVGVDVEKLDVGHANISEDPGYFRAANLADDEVAITIPEEKKMTNFEEWFRTFIDEKNLDVVEWTFQKDGYIDIHLDNYDAVEIICEKMNPADQEKVKRTIVQLDFLNGDINHFLHHIMKGYVEMLPSAE
jgi:hypothetical protein